MSTSLLTRRAAVVSRGVPLATNATVDRGRGARLESGGRSLIDLASGIGVCAAGHCPPSVVAAIEKQARELLHTCIHIATYEPYVALCEKLVAILPHGDATKAMLVNSGAEAVENAIKIARQATGRSGVVCFTGAFHGRTLLGMSLTSKVGYKAGCGPFAPEVYRLPFPSHYHDGDGLSVDRFVARELHRFEDALSTTVRAADVAAVIIEPVLGEGGFIPAPPGYLAGLRELCDRHGIMLIFDEVQTGFGRTGHLGAYQHYGVTPDLSTWAKALGGGLPIAAVLGRAEVMDAAQPGTIGGTYGGNPVSCAAALATIELIESENLAARALHIGETVRASFEVLKAKCPAVGDVRGLGAMMALELVEHGDPNRPATAAAAQVTEACLGRGVLVLRAGVHGNVVRVLCPLVISDDDLETALDVIVSEVLQKTS
jgi:4-aminobutyrate aminotransferase/(S)-3-amino-2-methylpropionate transaminase